MVGRVNFEDLLILEPAVYATLQSIDRPKVKAWR